jgi:hypothetical protein
MEGEDTVLRLIACDEIAVIPRGAISGGNSGKVTICQ